MLSKVQTLKPGDDDLQYITKYALNDYLAVVEPAYPLLSNDAFYDIDTNADQIITALLISSIAGVFVFIWVIYFEFNFISNRNFFFSLLLNIDPDSGKAANQDDLKSVTDHYLTSIHD